MVPSRTFLRAVIEGLVPANRAEPGARQSAIDYTTEFVDGQLRALPFVLQVALTVGLTVFRVTTFLRWFRGIGSLDVARRHAWLNAWAYGPLALTRSLFRPLRSLAVLAYYEAIQQ